eukprot:5646086-Pleurochrysis_carterae.AAC.1
MDASKDTGTRLDLIFGTKKEGILRKLLAEDAYDEKTTRAALAGVLRLLCGSACLLYTSDAADDTPCVDL